MTTHDVTDLLHRAEVLSDEEKLQLAALLIEQARQSERAASGEPRWQDLRGLYTHPALGEDAQAWITRTRQEGTNDRNPQRNSAS
jgi:hypothetical protein